MKMKQRLLLLFSVAVVSLAVIICIFFRADKELRIDDNRREAGDSIETSTESPLETLGKKLEELCLRGRISELEDYVVSERLTVEEAGLLAGQSQLLKHLSAYANNHWTITSAGICILQADINGDGIPDIVEYGPGEGEFFVNKSEEEINTLLIFLGEEDNTYSLHYSQPFFCTKVSWGEPIQVIEYENERYLLFFDTFEKRLSAHWLNHGIPDGKVEVQFKQVSTKAEILEETEGFDAEILLEDIHIYSPYLLDNLLDDVSTEIEMKVNWQIELYEEEKNKIFIEKYDTAFAEELHAFDAPLDVIPSVSYVYESDINNDGINEQYVKRQARLSLYTDDLFEAHIGGPPALTNTGYYGKHEGRNGLTYYMESAGEETDFKRLIGLDIWEGELTPLWFCVRHTEKGNVVYFLYQDENEYERRIDGYFADGKQYEKIGSIRCIPEMQCTLKYEVNGTEKNSGLDYFTCLTEDGRSVEFVFGSDHPLEAIINQNVQTRIAEKISEAEIEGVKYSLLDKYALAATEEKYVMEYMIVSERPLETNADRYDYKRYRMEVDLNTGVCRDIDGENEG